MQKKKDVFIEKIVKKDYNNELEKILEQKDFDENAKNLLLGLLYKIETSYEDYKKVKQITKTKEKYINSLLEIIKNKCDSIEIVRNKENILNGRTFIVDKENKKIVCLPIERKLFYAIEKIGKNEEIIHDEYFLINKTLSNTINIGNSINNVEVLRDFNGWSWSIVKSEIESIEYNLIYRNLEILLENNFLDKWVKNTKYIFDYLSLLKKLLNEKYGKENEKKILSLLNDLSILLELKVNSEFKEKLKKINYDLEEQFLKFSNKEQFIEETMERTKELKEKIKRIDEIRANKELLKEEYVIRNESLPFEKKIFSMRVLAEIMKSERDKLYQEYEEKNKLLNPKEFVKEKTKLEEKIELIQIIKEMDDNNFEESLQNLINFKLIDMQKIFLDCFFIKIQKAETRGEIIDLIYKLRYYYLTPFDINYDCFEKEEIREKLIFATKLLLKKAIEYKVVQNFSNDLEVNFDILSNIFKIKTIDLEKICIQIKKEKDEYFVLIYEADSCEYKSNLSKLTKENKGKLEIKLNKKEQVFI